MDQNLELAAMRYLRLEKRLPIIIRERSPRMGPCGQPDVFGVSQSRYVTEIEIKRSLSDFRADFDKRSRRNRDQIIRLAPKFFFYLVPEKIALSVSLRLPTWAGLMACVDSQHWCRVIRQAPENKESQRLSVRECARLVHQMANYTYSLELQLHNAERYFVSGREPYPPMEYEI